MSLITALAASNAPVPNRQDGPAPAQSTTISYAKAEVKSTNMPPVKRSDASAKPEMMTDGDRGLSIAEPQSTVRAKSRNEISGMLPNERDLAKRGATELVELREVQRPDRADDAYAEAKMDMPLGPNMDLRIPVPDNLPDKIPVNF